MSFSSDIKEELSKLTTLANKTQVKYELIGYLLTNHANIVNNKLRYATESEYNINRFSKLLANLKIDHNIEVEGNSFVIKLKIKDIPFEFEEIDNIKEAIASEASNNQTENKRAIIRGTFLGAGSVTNPENAYHLEVAFSNKENAKYIKEILEEFEITVKELEGNNKYSLYIKDGETISQYLALIGANKGILKFEDIRVQREMRAKVNRLVNCESANLNKTMNAAIEQIEAIKKLQKEHKFNLLDDNLKEIANLRLENPDMPLAELGKKLKEPIGKSGVNYRLKKLIELANLERK